MGKKLEHIEETIDGKTGQVTTIRKSFSKRVKNKEEFFMMFLSGLNEICALSRPSDIKILACLCERAEYNTGVVKLTASERKKITDKLKIKAQAFSNSLSRLKAAGLVSGSQGTYEVNPQHFWKGETNERQKILQAKEVKLLTNYKLEG